MTMTLCDCSMACNGSYSRCCQKSLSSWLQCFIIWGSASCVASARQHNGPAQHQTAVITEQWSHLLRYALVQTPKLRLHAHRLTDRTCLAVRLGLLNNLESLRISRMRDENDVQVNTHDDQFIYGFLFCNSVVAACLQPSSGAKFLNMQE